MDHENTNDILKINSKLFCTGMITVEEAIENVCYISKKFIEIPLEIDIDLLDHNPNLSKFQKVLLKRKLRKILKKART